MIMRLAVLRLLAMLLGALAPTQVPAQGAGALPGKLVIVVPYGPGNGLDLLAREFAEVLRTQQGATAVVENREGAGGVVGSAHVARAAADGQTLLFTAHPPFVSAPLLNRPPAYDPAASFVPVVRLGSVPMVLITSARSSFTNFQQMREFVAANPDKATYAHSGVGSPGQLFTELIKQAAKLPMLREIPYKSTGQAMIDAIAGTVLVSMVSFPAAQPHLKAGSIRLLATGGLQRLKDHGEVPTLAEALGRPDFEAGVWYGVLVPAGTPPERVARLAEAFGKAHGAASVGAFMARSSIAPLLLSSSEFAGAIRRDTEVARSLIDAARLGER